MYSPTFFGAYLFISIASILPRASAWHNSIKFDLTVNNISSYSMNLFESSFMDRDFFSLISSNRNNHMDDKTKRVFLGGRLLNVPILKVLLNKGF